MRTLNKERVKLLVEALRSDRFQQGRRHLKRANLDGSVRHCCLGVACEIAIEQGLSVNVGDDLRVGAVSFDHSNDVLPESVQDWFGFDGSNPRLTPLKSKFVWWRLFWQPKSEHAISATLANDERGMSFGQIADAFERTYL